jgi:hypothetical protein
VILANDIFVVDHLQGRFFVVFECWETVKVVLGAKRLASGPAVYLVQTDHVKEEINDQCSSCCQEREHVGERPIGSEKQAELLGGR